MAVYLLLCIGVGVWAMRRTKSASDFFVADRSLGPAVVGLAIFSSTISGFGFVGGPGLVYSTGINSLWMCLTPPLGFALGFYLVAKRIRIMAEVRDTLSLPDIVAARYDSEAARLLMAITIILGHGLPGDADPCHGHRAQGLVEWYGDVCGHQSDYLRTDFDLSPAFLQRDRWNNRVRLYRSHPGRRHDLRGCPSIHHSDQRFGRRRRAAGPRIAQGRFESIAPTARYAVRS